MSELVIPVITIILSIGGAVFATGRMLGAMCERVDHLKKDCEKNASATAELRDDFEGSLNNGIRKSISRIDSAIAVIDSTLKSFIENDREKHGTIDKKLDEMSRCMSSIKQDVAYMRGAINRKRTREDTEVDS